jgi:cytochrome c
MSDLGFNKIAFCVLGTGLALIGLNEASHAFFPATHHEKDGYAIAIPETPAGGEATPAVAEGPRDYFKLLSTADVEAGKAVAVKCQQCHKFEQGAESLQGPPLFGIVGRQIASHPGFKYTTGAGSMTDHSFAPDGVWNYEHLDRYLEAPKKLVPNTAMNFIGLKKQKDRADIIAYMRTLTTGEPLPLPAPLPEQPAAPADGAVVPTNGAAPAPGPAAPTTPGAATPAPAQPAPAQPAPH